MRWRCGVGDCGLGRCQMREPERSRAAGGPRRATPAYSAIFDPVFLVQIQASVIGY